MLDPHGILNGEAIKVVKGIAHDLAVTIVWFVASQSIKSYKKVPEFDLTSILNAVIAEPPLSGALHLINTESPYIDVIGARG